MIFQKDLLKAAMELKSKCKEEGSKLIKKVVKNVLLDYKKWVIKKMRKKNQNTCKKNQLLLENVENWHVINEFIKH